MAEGGGGRGASPVCGDADDDDFVDDDEEEFDEDASGGDVVADGSDGVDDRQFDVAMDAEGCGTPQRAVVSRREQLVWTSESLFDQQQRVIAEVVDLLEISAATARVLLRHYRWNKDRLKEHFFEDPERVLRQLGLQQRSGDVLRFGGGSEQQAVACSVCLDACSDVRDGRGFAALGQCGHWFCVPCFGQYLATEVAAKGMNALGTTCPMTGCGSACDFEVFEMILGQAALQAPFEGQNAELLAKFKAFEARSFVEHNQQVKWCPAPGCGNAVCLPGFLGGPQRPYVVQCECGMEFCFLCSEENHAPASCDHLKAWLKKEQDESETANWISANTKPCPNCHATVEKNGGCNHMTCSTCKHGWCWVCEQPWAKHGTSWYQCNFYDEGKDAQKSDRDAARRDLERYIHYYTRYRNHQDGEKYAKKTHLSKARQEMRRMQEQKHERLDQVEYLEEAAIQLIRSRHTLKFTYVYAFHLSDGPAKSLFEYNQADLEHGTEELSRLLESKGEAERQAVVNQQVLVRQSLQRLQTGVYQHNTGDGSPRPG